MSTFSEKLEKFALDAYRVKAMVSFLAVRYFKGNETEGEELLSLAYTKILIKKSKQICYCSIESYIARTARNLYIDIFRHKKSSKSIDIISYGESNELDLLLQDYEIEKEAEKSKQILIENVEYVLSNLKEYILDEKKRTIFIDKLIYGKSYREMEKEYYKKDIEGRKAYNANGLKTTLSRTLKAFKEEIHRRHPHFSIELITKK